MTEKEEVLELRLMNLERAFNSLSERITKLETKMSLLAFIGAAILTTSISTLITIFFRF